MYCDFGWSWNSFAQLLMFFPLPRLQVLCDFCNQTEPRSPYGLLSFYLRLCFYYYTGGSGEVKRVDSLHLSFNNDWMFSGGLCLK